MESHALKYDVAKKLFLYLIFYTRSFSDFLYGFTHIYISFGYYVTD